VSNWVYWRERTSSVLVTEPVFLPVPRAKTTAVPMVQVKEQLSMLESVK
jgi:hypothetical protein